MSKESVVGLRPVFLSASSTSSKILSGCCGSGPLSSRVVELMVETKSVNLSSKSRTGSFGFCLEASPEYCALRVLIFVAISSGLMPNDSRKTLVASFQLMYDVRSGHSIIRLTCLLYFAGTKDGRLLTRISSFHPQRCVH